MSALATLLQATTVEPLPDEAAASGVALAADPAATAAAPATEGGMNLLQLILHASLPVQLVMLLLLLASVASWVIIFRKKRMLDRAEKEAERFEEKFWSGADLGKLYTAASERNRDVEGLEAIFEAGYREHGKSRLRRGADARMQLEGAQRGMRVATARELDGLEHNLEFLANVGSIAPYVGLLGTVWGIMVAFHGLANVKEATIASVAPGISEALIATAMGLFAAIPAVWAYNRFATRVERIAGRYDAFSEEFSSILERQSHLAEG
jgi:biopolymer transport protein TolQ